MRVVRDGYMVKYFERTRMLFASSDGKEGRRKYRVRRGVCTRAGCTSTITDEEGNARAKRGKDETGIHTIMKHYTRLVIMHCVAKGTTEAEKR